MLALLSFLWPGLGQMVGGRFVGGLLWMMFTLLGYLAAVFPGLILHVLCIVHAYQLGRANFVKDMKTALGNR